MVIQCWQGITITDRERLLRQQEQELFVRALARQGFIANIEVFNGKGGGGKIEQALGGKRFLESILQDSKAKIASGIFTSRQRTTMESASLLSFAIYIRKYEEEILDIIAEKAARYLKDGNEIPKNDLNIYTKKLFSEGKKDISKKELFSILYDMAGKKVCGKSNPFGYVFTEPTVELRDEINKYDLISPSLKEVEDYSQQVASLKGDFLEIYAAELFRKEVRDCYIYVDYKFSIKEARSEEEKTDEKKGNGSITAVQYITSDIDVLIASHEKEFRNALEAISKKEEYHVEIFSK
jgi:hypothetical protein